MVIHPYKGASFNAETYKALGEPKYVNILYHRAKKIVIVRSCEDDATGAYQITGDRGRFNVIQRSLSDVLYQLTNWSRDISYKCVGKYDTEAAGVVFNLNIAEMIEKRPYTRRNAVTA